MIYPISFTSPSRLPCPCCPSCPLSSSLPVPCPRPPAAHHVLTPSSPLAPRPCITVPHCPPPPGLHPMSWHHVPHSPPPPCIAMLALPGTCSWMMGGQG